MNAEAITTTNPFSPETLPAPAELRRLLPISGKQAQFVGQARATIADILFGNDSRLLVLAGPCSIGHLGAAEEYAERLNELAAEVSDVMFLCMRAYCQKPRTTLGWKGFLYDPYLDGSCRLTDGLMLGRRFMLRLTELQLPAAVEAVDPLLNEYLQDAVSWTAIGARTVESQTHREYASGIQSPVGFKNRTDGNIDCAINAVLAAHASHLCWSLSPAGTIVMQRTPGNPHSHIVLRGSSTRPNYDCVSVRLCEAKLREAGLAPSLVIDCSHGNSGKDHERQATAFNDCTNQITEGSRSIRGLMLESNLLPGAQELEPKRELVPGLSFTDACIGWRTTEELLLRSAEKLRRSTFARNLRT